MSADKSIEMDRDVRFMRACVAALGYEGGENSIGTYAERAVHRVMKFYVEPREEYHEVKHLGCVADVKNERGITEIQTKAFSRMKDKLEAFLESDKVTVLYPVIAKKYIRILDADTGELGARKLSPKRMRAFDAAYEIYNIREYLGRDNFSLKLVFLEAEEIRQQGIKVKVAGRTRTRMKVNTVPTAILDELDLSSREDYIAFIPEGLSHRFTVSELGKAVGKRFPYGYSIVSILLSVGLLEGPVSEGRRKVYSLTDGAVSLMESYYK